MKSNTVTEILLAFDTLQPFITWHVDCSKVRLNLRTFSVDLDFSVGMPSKKSYRLN